MTLGLLAFKRDLIAFLGGNGLALSMLAAVGIQFAAAFVFRRRLGHWLPLGAALAALVVNELLATLEDRVVAPGEELLALRDIGFGMLIPTALTLIARYYPIILTPPMGRARESGRESLVDEKVEQAR